MNRELEAWMWCDPAKVVERIELQANAKAAREYEKLMARQDKLANQARIKAKVFKKAGAA